MCQPEPLKIRPAAENTLRSPPPQSSHTVSASSENDCTTSRRVPHSRQRYS
jgi:hypothetical protein